MKWLFDTGILEIESRLGSIDFSTLPTHIFRRAKNQRARPWSRRHFIAEDPLLIEGESLPDAILWLVFSRERLKPTLPNLPSQRKKNAIFFPRRPQQFIAEAQ